MRKIFKEAQQEKEIMDRLIELKEKIHLYKVAYQQVVRNYKSACGAYEVTDNDVEIYKELKIKQKPVTKLRRRNCAKSNTKPRALGAIFKTDKIETINLG
jgi:hypothetical protein